MKTILLLLVLMAASVTLSQSQEVVSAAETTATVEYSSNLKPVFTNEATSPICMTQMIQRPTRELVNYWIYIKNTGETELTNVRLKVTPPTNFTHKSSNYAHPTTGRIPPIELVSNRDGTTNLLLLDLGNLETGGSKTIIVSLVPKSADDRANAHKNAVEVTAEALSRSERDRFETAAMHISAINVVCYDPVVDGDVKSYRILVENKARTRLTDVFLNATLPRNAQHLDSRYSDPKGESILPRPTEIRNPDGTTYLRWFLGDLETGSSKSIELNVTCGDERCPDLGKDRLEASGWTSIVYKNPIKVTSKSSGTTTASELNRSAAGPQ